MFWLQNSNLRKNILNTSHGYYIFCMFIITGYREPDSQFWTDPHPTAGWASPSSQFIDAPGKSDAPNCPSRKSMLHHFVLMLRTDLTINCLSAALLNYLCVLWIWANHLYLCSLTQLLTNLWKSVTCLLALTTNVLNFQMSERYQENKLKGRKVNFNPTYLKHTFLLIRLVAVAKSFLI